MCACRGRRSEKFLWIPEEGSVDGENTIIYNTEIEAKAKVFRHGGKYYTEAAWKQLVAERTLAAMRR